MALLNTYDLQSEAWRKLNEYLNARLTSARIELEKNITPIESAYLRGRIQFIKQLQSAALATDDEVNNR